ncbi:hypothetical protein CEUSTIGMA_g2733.t1 [Chlamydomonas eustigma]|uniref:AB hydrolase-1 domain-containing protein n=1 Tax=Chlamydomonas eustigma TaxID=1157962 RepID=A0A250WWS2_9CHLO|nr:hypothetical protein CEUSTIGMA_g2733.t1 [Chlamydomonas eustigma]|eukprot:GAX75288.1 hypothetical protein CEUSTIGMA_g2733.t1 [Chlamydomonas eustigma]
MTHRQHSFLLKLFPVLKFTKGSAANTANSIALLGRQFHNIPKIQTSILAYEEVIATPTDHTNQQEEVLPAHTAVLLHGLLGSGRNWRSFAKRFVNEASQRVGAPYRLLLVDLRNHGASTSRRNLTPPHSVEAAAHDVLRLMCEVLPEGSPRALIGHSMGGKVAMEAIRLLSEQQQQQQDQKPPAQVWVLDSVPGKVLDDMEAKSGVSHVLDIVHDVQLPVPSRQHLLDYVRKERGLSEATALWLGSSLVSDARGQLVWAFNVQGAAAMYHSYRMTDCWNVVERPPHGVDVHLVRGELSDRWHDLQIRRLEAASLKSQETREEQQPQQSVAASVAAPGSLVTSRSGSFYYHILPAAGHWVHTDNGPRLHSLMLDSLTK